METYLNYTDINIPIGIKMIGLKDIKKLRLSIGLTQKELAKLTGLSQSFITKVESGRIEPSYTKTLLIINTLTGFIKGVSAKDVMNKNIISIEWNKRISSAINLMKKNNISQILVTKNKNFIGLITEKSIMNNIGKELIKDAMVDLPPIISEQASINLVKELLKEYPLIIVNSKNKIKGIITKSDIIFNMK